MDIWSWIVVFIIALIAILSVIDNLTQKRKVNDKLRALYAIIYQTKEHTRIVSSFHDNIGKIKKQLPQINDNELVKINISLLHKSWALAATTCSRIEKTFDFTKNISSTNSTISNEDSQFMDDILKTTYGDEYDNYEIDLYDDKIESINKILDEEMNKLAIDNIE